MTTTIDSCQPVPYDASATISGTAPRRPARRRLLGRRRRAGRRRGGRQGLAIVETALVLNICLLFLLALYDFSRVILVQQLVINAAREGCRYAIVSTDTATTTQVQAYVTNYLCGMQISSLVINVFEANPANGANIGTWTNAGLSDYIGVQITGKINTITPTFSMLPSTVAVSATAVMACEGD
jgi:Flp pilus assembly protein TadG